MGKTWKRTGQKSRQPSWEGNSQQVPSSLMATVSSRRRDDDEQVPEMLWKCREFFGNWCGKDTQPNLMKWIPDFSIEHGNFGGVSWIWRQTDVHPRCLMNHIEKIPKSPGCCQGSSELSWSTWWQKLAHCAAPIIMTVEPPQHGLEF